MIFRNLLRHVIQLVNRNLANTCFGTANENPDISSSHFSVDILRKMNFLEEESEKLKVTSCTEVVTKSVNIRKLMSLIGDYNFLFHFEILFDWK